MPKISHLKIIESDEARSRSPGSLEADLAWVAKRGVQVERLTQNSPLENETVISSDCISRVFIPSFPLVEVDGSMALSGRYPTREEMGIWMMFGFVRPEEKNTGGIRCCTL